MLKNTKYITFISFGLILVAFSVFGYFKSISIPDNVSGPQPKIEITPKEYNFGEVAYGDVLEYGFVVKNIGELPLEIKRIATSCSCTTVKISSDIIEPGQEANLQVTYNTAAMTGSHGKGKQERIIYVKSNDPLSPQVTSMIFADVR